MSKMRKDEVYAKTRFDMYLRKVASENIKWQDGDQNTPPDFYLSIDNINFVVEVTAIIEQIALPTKKKIMSRVGITKSVKYFIKEVQSTAIQLGILTGTYYVSVPKVDFYLYKEAIKQNLLDYIRNTQLSTENRSEDIHIDEIRYATISKMPNSKENRLSVGTFPNRIIWGDQWEVEACGILRGVISRKIGALSKFNQPKILLLINQYPFIAHATYQNCILTIPNIENFHTIFLVYNFNDGPDVILYSKNPQWLLPLG